MADLSSMFSVNMRFVFICFSQQQKTKILKKELMETCSTPKERKRMYYNDLYYVILYLRKIKHFLALS